VQGVIYKQRITRAVNFGPNFVIFKSRLSRNVNFTQ
jgi:hypothetical protein